MHIAIQLIACGMPIASAIDSNLRTASSYASLRLPASAKDSMLPRTSTTSGCSIRRDPTLFQATSRGSSKLVSTTSECSIRRDPGYKRGGIWLTSTNCPTDKHRSRIAPNGGRRKSGRKRCVAYMERKILWERISEWRADSQPMMDRRVKENT